MSESPDPITIAAVASAAGTVAGARSQLQEGKDIEDEDRKIEVLRSMGISGEQFTQLVDDISSLTKWQEDRDEDFLPI